MREDNNRTVFSQNKTKYRKLPTIQSCQPTNYHPLDVDAKLLSCQFFVTSDYFYTCERKQTISVWTGHWTEALTLAKTNYLSLPVAELQFKTSEKDISSDSEVREVRKKMLTESLLAVAELQPLYGSVDAVWAHDRPGNRQKHNRVKNITSCLIQKPSSPSSVLSCTK